MDDKFTEQEGTQSKSGRGCTMLAIAAVVLIGLIMWMILWGRAAPKTDIPVNPATEVQTR